MSGSSNSVVKRYEGNHDRARLSRPLQRDCVGLMVGGIFNLFSSDKPNWVSRPFSSENEGTISRLQLPNERVCLVVDDGLGKVCQFFCSSRAVSGVPYWVVFLSLNWEVGGNDLI